MDFKEWLQANENWYGTYCGPGPALNQPSCDALKDGAPLPNPIDSVDKACQKHDKDYCTAGKDWRAALPFSLHKSPESNQADVDFFNTVYDLYKSGQLPPRAKRFARLITAYFRGAK